ncbi:hypothetical protein [Microcoleus sp. herbarium12]
MSYWRGRGNGWVKMFNRKSTRIGWRSHFFIRINTPAVRQGFKPAPQS